MSIQNFIPTIWSEVLYEELSKKYVGVANCSRDYEGEIKECGSQVRIAGLEPVEIFEYYANGSIPTPEVLNDNITTLNISRAVGFNFAVDDVERIQASSNLMNLAMRNAANALANEADSYVYKLAERIDDRTVSIYGVNTENIIDTFIKAREMLYDGEIYDTSDIVIEVSPAVASLILKAKLVYGTSDNAATLSNGCIGTLLGCKVYVSKNIMVSGNTHMCLMRSKRAITFAEQLSEISAYRPESTFADAVKGLHLYGAQIVYPREIVRLDMTFEY